MNAIFTDTPGGLLLQLNCALGTASEDPERLRAGIATLAEVIDRLLLRLPELSLDSTTLMHVSVTATATGIDPLRTLLASVCDIRMSDKALSSRLDTELGDAWRDLQQSYDAHQLRQAKLLEGHLEEEELREWLECPLDEPVVLPETTINEASRYPAEQIGYVLRYRVAIWHIVSGVRAALNRQDHEGWLHFELSLLLVDELRRRHAREEQGLREEWTKALFEGDESAMLMWKEARLEAIRNHQMWWRHFAPLYHFLTQELELCPTGLDRVFQALGQDVWDMPLMELLSQAREILV